MRSHRRECLERNGHNSFVTHRGVMLPFVSSGGDSTLSHFEELAPASWGTAPILYLVLDCERPLGASIRVSLADVKEVTFGRGAETSFARQGARLAIRLPDRWMSSTHARMTNVGGGWTLADLGSKNGTLLNGTACNEEHVEPGDLFEVGHTLILFREGAVSARTPREIDAGALRGPRSRSSPPSWRRSRISSRRWRTSRRARTSR